MTTLNFENLEYFDAGCKSWNKAEFLGVAGEDKYLIGVDNDLSKQDIFEADEKDLRVVTHVRDLDDCSDSNALYEYCYKKDSYIPCEILSKKGKFYSIKTNTYACSSERRDEFNENACISTISIIREKQLRKVTSTRFSQYVNSKINKQDENKVYGDIHIEIPSALTDLIVSESIAELMSNLSNDFSICYYSTFRTDTVNYLRIFSLTQHLSTIQLMIEVAIQNELKLIKYESDKHSTLQKLQTVKKELDKIKRFLISKELVGLLIGLKGANLNRLKQKYNVTIVIQSDIPGDDALVTITGENEKSVEECVKEAKFVKKSLEVKQNSEGKLKPVINELLQKYNFLKIFFTREKLKDDSRGNYFLSYLNIIGTENSVDEILTNRELNSYLIN